MRQQLLVHMQNFVIIKNITLKLWLERFLKNLDFEKKQQHQLYNITCIEVINHTEGSKYLQLARMNFEIMKQNIDSQWYSTLNCKNIIFYFILEYHLTK